LLILSRRDGPAASRKRKGKKKWLSIALGKKKKREDTDQPKITIGSKATG